MRLEAEAVVVGVVDVGSRTTRKPWGTVGHLIDILKSKRPGPSTAH